MHLSSLLSHAITLAENNRGNGSNICECRLDPPSSPLWAIYQWSKPQRFDWHAQFFWWKMKNFRKKKLYVWSICVIIQAWLSHVYRRDDVVTLFKVTHPGWVQLICRARVAIKRRLYWQVDSHPLNDSVCSAFDGKGMRKQVPRMKGVIVNIQESCFTLCCTAALQVITLVSLWPRMMLTLWMDLSPFHKIPTESGGVQMSPGVPFWKQLNK